MRGLSQFPPLWILLHKPPHQSPSVPASPQGEAFILAHRHKPIPEPPDYPGVFFIQKERSNPWNALAIKYLLYKVYFINFSFLPKYSHQDPYTSDPKHMYRTENSFRQVEQEDP